MSKGVNLLQGFNEFLDTFGHMTVAQITVIIFAFVFLYAVYKKISDYLMKKHDAAQAKDAQLAQALETVSHYPEYRQQSIAIQKHFEDEIKMLQDGLAVALERIATVEEQNKKRECNKLKDILLERYRYYTNKECNPTQSWSRMESEAFWDLFKDYEEAGGDGYMHTHVQPDMERLTVIEMSKETIQN